MIERQKSSYCCLRFLDILIIALLYGVSVGYETSRRRKKYNSGLYVLFLIISMTPTAI